MKKFAEKNILITGSAGFLATYLADECVSEGASIYGVDIVKPFNQNIWKEFSLQGVEHSDALFEKNKFDFVFHLAGGASVAESVNFPEKDFNRILPATFFLIQQIKKYSPSAHIIFFSSAAVYGSPKSLPVNEFAELMPLSPYGIHKAVAENLLKYYVEYFNLRCSVLRIFSAFGNGLRKQLFWDVMLKYKSQIEQGNDKIQLQLFGTGNESRDFIHAEDVAKAAVLIAANNHEKFSVFNVAGGNETSVKTAVDFLFQHLKNKPEIQFTGTSRTGDPEKWKADISKLHSLGFQTKISLNSGLEDYFNWSLAEI